MSRKTVIDAETAAGAEAEVERIEGLDPRPTPLPPRMPSMPSVARAGSTKRWPPAKRSATTKRVPAARGRLSGALRAWDAAVRSEAQDDEGLAASVRAASEQPGGDGER